MYENLEAYNYLPDYKQTSEFIMRAYWDIMSNRTTCDEERNWLQWIIEDHINDAFFEKDATEKNEEEEASKYLTYIPDEVETGIVKTR